jgi:hypothetical protein
MPESWNVEFAHKLSENGHHPAQQQRWHSIAETVEVVVLALVALATAWSGYQAARWEGHQALLYGQASRDRFQADAKTTEAGDTLQQDLTLFSGWLQARSSGDTQLQDVYVRRMSPEYRAAFEAWLNTYPLINPQAPAGPSLMPEYRNPPAEEAKILNDQASATFDAGTEARETADNYVRNTILLATVLFLVAIGQRFKDHRVRIGANIVAAVLLVGTLASLATLPRY